MVEESETAPDPLASLGPARSRRQPTLTLAHHSDPSLLGARLVLSGSSLTLGRNSEIFGEGVLSDDLLSRQHVELRVRDGKIEVRDLGSRNGCFVNGARQQTATLAMGDVLGIGAVMFIAGEGPSSFERPTDPLLAGVSYALASVLDEIRTVARQDVTVLIRGETGVGKELVAERIHQQSGRTGELVAVNCGGVAEGVVHSELFGHVRGAFSGAEGDRQGLVEAASGGTLLLDEIGDASDKLQTSLLRLLQNNEYRAVGSDERRISDARFVAATHVRLDPAVSEGRFRQDLLARLRRWVISVPPLRERREDVIPIALHIARRLRGSDTTISRPLALELLKQTWPDNVRGLAAMIETAAVDAEGSELTLTDRVRARLEDMGRDEQSSSPPSALAYRKQRPEKAYLESRFVELDCNVKAFAGELGIARNTLYRWFQEAGIDPKSLRS
jgi:DNA-binding NtrC family response regulator